MDDRIKWEQLAAGSWRGRCGPACYAIFETSHRPPKIRIEHDRRSLDGYCLGPVDGDVESAKRVCEIHNSANAAEYALANGYVKLAEDEIVVKRGTLNALIDDHCADCTFDSLEIHDCERCDLKPLRENMEKNT